jgi:hypothetical protein
MATLVPLDVYGMSCIQEMTYANPRDEKALKFKYIAINYYYFIKLY